MNSALPGHLTYQPSCITSIPNCIEMTDAWNTNASGLGDATHTLQSSLGEYYERRHFYLEVAADTRGTISTDLRPTEISALTKALFQTCSFNYPTEAIIQHTFNLSRVFRTNDLSQCHIPTSLISIGHHKIEGDTPFYPRRDTCGCSFHSTLEAAVNNALKEAIERQLLLKFWLTGECAQRITLPRTATLLKRSERQLLNLLHQSGEIELYELSDSRFPGACVLATYGNRSTHRQVRYCAGMSYSATVAEALKKSVLELWQTFRFMSGYKDTQISSTPKLDPYLQHFLDCNTYDTFLSLKNGSSIGTQKDITNLEQLNSTSMLAALKTHGFSGYIYLKPETIGLYTFYHCKFVSPDFFLHMNNSANINIHNKFSAEFFARVMPDRQSVMVPFP